MKTIRHYVAKCHVCGGTGCHNEGYAKVLGLSYIPECSVCDGNGFVSIFCEEDPVLVEVFTIPDGKSSDFALGRRTLVEFENPYDDILRRDVK